MALVLALIAPAALAQMGSTDYSYIDIEKAAPLVEFKDSRLTMISGGVEIVLRSADETVQPMRLGAQEITFEWPSDGGNSPTAINLNESVRVDSPQGDIRSSRAILDLNASLLTFTGSVSGSSEQIASFDADQIVYDLESGDSEMVNLRATGIGLTGGEGDVSSADTDYSEMDIDRAGLVKFSNGQVNTMSGGVSITMQPAQANAQRLKLSAADVAITWTPTGQPAAMQMRGSVRVDGPQGDIRSERADLNLGKKSLEFTGNVKGTTEQIESFDTDKLTYNLDTGDTDMINLRAQGLDIGQPAPEVETEEAESASPFSKMDIEKAPEVSMTAGKLNWMRGGVSIRIHGREEDAPPLALDADELTFAYSEGVASPDHVVMTGNVIVDGPDTDIESDTADLDMASNTLTFTGNVRGSQPGLTGAKAKRVVYDLKTGNLSMQGTSIEEMDHRRMNEEPETTEEPAPQQ
jgi:lipopolysaccharide assembly outer membrane protein LptD (OstA)